MEFAKSALKKSTVEIFLQYSVSGKIRLHWDLTAIALIVIAHRSDAGFAREVRDRDEGTAIQV